MPADTDANGNQRVTNAVLALKIDAQGEVLKDIKDAIKELSSGQNDNRNRITALETKSKIWDGINSLGVVIAGIIGVNK